LKEELEVWLDHEDDVCREDRIERLKWLAQIYPPIEYAFFPDGLMAKMLFEEMRYSFVYAQYLATIVVGMAYIERTLAAQLYASGRNDLERAGLGALLKGAAEVGFLPTDEIEELEIIRERRNPVAHFRRPMAESSVELRTLKVNRDAYDLLEDDARAVILAAMRSLVRSGGQACEGGAGGQ